MTREERLSVRLPSDYVLMLKELVYQGNYSSEAEAVLDAVKKLIDSNFTDEEIQSILEKARTRKNIDLSAFTKNNEDVSATLSKVISRTYDNDQEYD